MTTNGGVLTKNREIVWNSDLAYAVGLFVADGHLSKDGRHLDFTSKDEEQVEHFAECLAIQNIITKKSRSAKSEKKYFHVQFGDVTLYRFFNSIGLFNNKSLTIEQVNIPDDLIADFLRGLHDGDGSISYNKHPESKHTQVRIRFSSGSHEFLIWLMSLIAGKYKIDGGFIVRGGRCWQLGYGKADSMFLLSQMYLKSKYYLKRKHDVYEEIKSLLKAENSVQFIG